MAGDETQLYDSGLIEEGVFQQILDMDEEEGGGDEFSRSIVFDFFGQAEDTFAKMDAALKKKKPQRTV